jgi:hypothetical protein
MNEINPILSTEKPVDSRFASTFYVQQATDEERFLWWQLYAKQNTHDLMITRKPEHLVDWLSDSSGKSVTVGTFAGMPVRICVSWATINGQRVMFYSPVSQVSHSELINNWLEMHIPCMKQPERNHSNSCNFHNCLRAIERVNNLPVV